MLNFLKMTETFLKLDVLLRATFIASYSAKSSLTTPA